MKDSKSNEKNIRFSILTPVYNVEKYICDCIDSVLGQSYGNFELILVNDGSTDSSGKICDKYAAKDNRIKVIHKENEGLLITRRRALQEARGEYCVILDSDDTLEKNTLEIIYKNICTYDCDLVIYGLKKVLNGNVISCVSETDKHPYIIEDKRELYRKFFLSNRYNSLCRKSFKRTLVDNESYEMFRGVDIAEDLLQSVELIKNSKKTVFIPDVLYSYTMNPNSITHSYNFKSYKVNLSIYEYVFDFLVNESVFTDEDYCALKQYYSNDVVSHLLIISGFGIEYEKKVGLFEKIKETDIYKVFLVSPQYNANSKGFKGVIFSQFKKGHYKNVIWISQTVNLIKRLTNLNWKGR